MPLRPAGPRGEPFPQRGAGTRGVWASPGRAGGSGRGGRKGSGQLREAAAAAPRASREARPGARGEVRRAWGFSGGFFASQGVTEPPSRWQRSGRGRQRRAVGLFVPSVIN